MAISVEELKEYLNVDADDSSYNRILGQLLAAAKEDLNIATGKILDEDNALVRQFIKLYCRREFDMLSDAAVDNRLRDIQTKILHSLRFEEET